MNLNNRNSFKYDDLSSYKSKNYELKSDTLDQLYKEQLTELRDLILKTAEPDDIEKCRKWLKVFNRSSKAEKMARNCLCTLMQEQLKEFGYLQEPFTNLQNCYRSLESILRELDEQNSTNLSNQSFATGSDATFQSHGFITEITLEQQQAMNDILQENQNIELKDETNELQALRLQLTEKEIENIKLKEIAENCRSEREKFEETLNNMKKTILENIREILLDMDQCGVVKPEFKFFQHIFAQFSDDKEFTDIVSKYDLDLHYVLQKQVKCEFEKRKSLIARHICRKFVKSKTKLREKFENRLTLQNESHKLQLKLAKLNSFSILRQIFINYHNELDKCEGWNILKTLEDRYQNVVNGDLK